jgi:hypothetical protein
MQEALLELADLRRGDIVTRALRAGARHWGIVAAQATTSESARIIENGPQGIQELALEEFLGDESSFRVEKLTEATFSPEEIVRRAREALANPKDAYNIFHNNCEAFVRECATGRRESEQVEMVRNKGRQFGLAALMLGGAVLAVGIIAITVVEMTRKPNPV